jgi:hypothetical protein
MGKVVQAFREHPYHGRRISQTTAARWLYLTQSRLSRIESGPPMHDLHRLTKIAHILGLPHHLLWFAPVEEAELQYEIPPSTALQLADSEHSSGDHAWQVVSEMLRRTFLQGGLAALSVEAARLNQALTPSTTVDVAAAQHFGSPGYSSQAVHFDLVSSMSAALLSPGQHAIAPLDTKQLKQQAIRAWELRQSTNYEALGELLSYSLAEAEAARKQVQSESEELTATAAFVHVHNAASALLKRLQAPELGAIAADRALQAARAADDDLLIGAATLRLANVFLAADKPTEALDTATDGADALLAHMNDGPAYAATWGALLLTGAVAAANLEESAQAWELLGQAKVASSLLKQEYAGLHALFGPVNLAIHGVQLAAELGNPREALRRAARIDVDSLPPTLLERRSTLLLDTARCHKAEGDHDAALGALLSAEHVAPQEVRYNPVARELTSELLATPKGRDSDLRALATRLEVLG